VSIQLNRNLPPHPPSQSVATVAVRHWRLVCRHTGFGNNLKRVQTFSSPARKGQFFISALIVRYSLSSTP
jgi:hypothetical protein